MSSSIPGAIQAFMTVAGAALPAGSQVWFGKTLGTYVAPVTLQVNGTVNGRQEPAELGPSYRREEEYEFSCTLTCWAGDEDFMQRMLDTFTNFGLLTVALANNPTMNGTVRFVQVTTLNFTPDSTAPGASSGILAFNVNCQQRITSLT